MALEGMEVTFRGEVCVYHVAFRAGCTSDLTVILFRWIRYWGKSNRETRWNVRSSKSACLDIW